MSAICLNRAGKRLNAFFSVRPFGKSGSCAAVEARRRCCLRNFRKTERDACDTQRRSVAGKSAFRGSWGGAGRGSWAFSVSGGIWRGPRFRALRILKFRKGIFFRFTVSHGSLSKRSGAGTFSQYGYALPFATQEPREKIVNRLD